jgi:hypothetical protein
LLEKTPEGTQQSHFAPQAILSNPAMGR